MVLLFLLLDMASSTEALPCCTCTRGCAFCWWQPWCQPDLLAAVYQMLKLATPSCKPAAEQAVSPACC